MKRMVKNGNLLDVKPNGDLGIKGNAQVGGRLQVKSSIISTGEIRGGDISGTKFLLGTEEMPLVKANPTGEATETLEKVKIGNVAYKVGGGGGGDERNLKLIFPYAKTDASSDKKLYIDDDIYNKIRECYYETIKLYYNDGNPIGVFHVFNFFDSYNQILSTSRNYFCISTRQESSISTWFGSQQVYYAFALLYYSSDSNGKYLYLTQYNSKTLPTLEQAKFDALYKLADKPTQDGTYVLKATVSGGAVTYTWEPQA